MLRKRQEQATRRAATCVGLAALNRILEAQGEATLTGSSRTRWGARLQSRTPGVDRDI